MSVICRALRSITSKARSLRSSATAPPTSGRISATDEMRLIQVLLCIGELRLSPAQCVARMERQHNPGQTSPGIIPLHGGSQNGTSGACERQECRVYLFMTPRRQTEKHAF